MTAIPSTSFFVSADRFLDRVPILSTISNITDIFLKCIVNRMSDTTINKYPYFTHLSKKSFSHCFLLLIPVIGNIIVGILNSKNWDKENFVLDAINEDPSALKKASSRLKSSRDFALQVAEKKGITLQYMEENFRKDNEICTLASNQSQGAACEFIHDELKREPEYAIELIRSTYNGAILRFMPELIKNNKDVVIAAVTRTPSAKQFASAELQNDPDVLAAAGQNVA